MSALVSILLGAVLLFLTRSQNDFSDRFVRTFLPCQDFDSTSWKKLGYRERYQFACDRICDQLVGKSVLEMKELMGDPHKHEGESIFLYSFLGDLSYKDTLEIHFENDKVNSCFLRD